jgi:hypothetical protein
MLIGNLSATIAFQLAWWIPLRRVYARIGSRRQAFMALEHDLLPIQLQGIRWTLTFAAFSVPLKALITLLIQRMNPHFAIYFPMGGVVLVTDALLVDATYIRIMGDIFDRRSWVLAQGFADLQSVALTEESPQMPQTVSQEMTLGFSSSSVEPRPE